MISLADTVGVAGPQQIGDLVGEVMAKYDYLEIGVHLHSRPEQAAERIIAAYNAGCRRFDSTLGGLGGCPFAQDALVGNIPTEKVIEVLSQQGADLPQLKPLDALLKATWRDWGQNTPLRTRQTKVATLWQPVKSVKPVTK